jgi:hypothetical protein
MSLAGSHRGVYNFRSPGIPRFGKELKRLGQPDLALCLGPKWHPLHPRLLVTKGMQIVRLAQSRARLM